MTHIDNGKGLATCKAKLGAEDHVVLAALHSDCVPCRTRLMIGPPGQHGCAVKEPLSYTPEPHPSVKP